MDALINHLTARGVLDPQTLDFARAYQSEHHTSLEDALLELDLIDEEGLLSGLASSYRMKAARPADIARASPEAGKQLSSGAAKAFGVCPLWYEDNTLTCLVERPLPEESVRELRELFGLATRPLVAPAHYSTLARAAVYGTKIPERSRELELRLAKCRQADVHATLKNLARAGSLAVATEQVIRFGVQLLEFVCCIVFKDERLRVAAASTGGPSPGTALEPPGPDCPLGPAIKHGGYYYGALPPSDDTRRFYESLARPVPRWAFVAPVPSSGEASIVFCVDNGPRGIAPRRIAELTLLVSRLARRSSGTVERLVRVGDSPTILGPRTPAADTSSTPPTHPGVTAEEMAVLQQLRAAALAANMTLPAFVADRLFHPANAPPPVDTTSTLLVELKGLFDKLATDIPAQFTRGIEGAFRDLAPRLAASAPQHAPFAAAGTPALASAVDWVAQDPTPREVPDYKSRRRKSTRVKL